MLRAEWPAELLLRGRGRLLIFTRSPSQWRKLLRRLHVGDLDDLALLACQFAGVVLGITPGGQVAAEAHRDGPGRLARGKVALDVRRLGHFGSFLA